MFGFVQFVAKAFMRSNETTPPNIAGTPSLLAAIREADCSVPGCRPNPGERLVFSAFGNAVSGLLAQSERGSVRFVAGASPLTRGDRNRDPHVLERRPMSAIRAGHDDAPPPPSTASEIKLSGRSGHGSPIAIDDFGVIDPHSGRA
jgi:hypothetical protein